MSNLIFNGRNKDGSFLLKDDIKRFAPAVYTEFPADHLSERYGMVNTADAVEVLGDYGWYPIAARQVRKRDATKNPFAEHFVAFAMDDEALGEGRAEIICYNSHDGSSSLKLFAGYFRFICNNGMVAGEGFKSRMYHSQATKRNFEDTLKEIIDQTPRMVERIHQMQATPVDMHTSEDFAVKALRSRWKPVNLAPQAVNEGICFDTQSVGETLTVRRMEDKPANAWTVFNRVQEAVVNGKVTLRSYQSPISYKIRKARPVTGPKKIIEVNRNLWDSAESILLAA